MKRNPLLTAFLASLVIGLGASAYFASRARSQERTAIDRAATISVQSEQLIRINSELSRSNKELTASVADRNRALTNLQRRTAENDLNQGVTECRNGRVARGLLYFARALETVPDGEDDLVFNIRANIATWGSKSHAQKWQTKTRSANIEPAMQMRQGPDGARLVTIHPGKLARGGAIRVWDSATGQPIGRPMIHLRNIVDARISADGESIVAVERDYSNYNVVSEAEQKRLTSSIIHWNVETGAQRSKPIVFSGFVSAAAVDPQRLRAFVSLAGGPLDEIGQIWDVRTGRPDVSIKNDESSTVLDAAFSPDGRLLITHCQMLNASNSANPRFGASPRVMRIWNSSTGAASSLNTQWDSPGQFTRVEDARLAITSPDVSRREIEVWPLYGMAGRLVPTPNTNSSSRRVIGFGRNGRLTITSESNLAGLPQLQIRESRTGNAVGQPLHGTHAVLCDDRDTAIVLSHGILEAWYLAGSAPKSLLRFERDGRPLSPRPLRLSVELLTGMTFTESGEVYYFDGSVREQKRQALQQLLHDPAKSSPKVP